MQKSHFFPLIFVLHVAVQFLTPDCDSQISTNKVDIMTFVYCVLT